MVRFRTTAIEFQYLEIFPLFKIFNRGGLNIIPAIIKFTAIMAEIIKDFLQVGINFFVEVRKMRPAVMIPRIREIKNFPRRYDAAETMTMPVFHFFHTETGPGVLLNQGFQTG